MQRFSETEAQEILRRAAQAPLLGEYTSEELRRSAAELGISDEALARAEAEVREERTRAEFEAALRSQLRNEAVGFALLMVMLLAINLVTSPHNLWFFWPLFGAIPLAKKLYSARDRHGDGYRRAFERWQETGGRPKNKELTKLLEDRDRT